MASNAWIEFGRMFLTYGLLLLIICVVAAVAITIGITLAKRKKDKAKPDWAETDRVEKGRD